MYRNHHLDSTRWDGFVPRDDDIFVTTAYKAGTTWTQRILAAFVFGPGPLAGSAQGHLAVDRRPLHGTDRADARDWSRRSGTAASSRAISPPTGCGSSRRRSTSSSDATPATCSCRCSTTTPGTRSSCTCCSTTPTGRDPSSRTVRRHRARCGRAGSARAGSTGSPTAGRSGRIITTSPPGGRFATCPTCCSSTTATSRPIPKPRCGASPRSASFDIDEDAWPALVATVGLDAMRAEARGADDPMSMVWKGGADQFFFKGTNGRWRDVLTDDDLALYETRGRHPRPRSSRLDGTRPRGPRRRALIITTTEPRRNVCRRPNHRSAPDRLAAHR